MEFKCCNVLNGIVRKGSNVKVHNTDNIYAVGVVEDIWKLGNGMYVKVRMPNGDWITKTNNFIELIKGE